MSLNKFFNVIIEVLEKIRRFEADKIELAANLISNAWENENFVHIFGAGHNQIYAQEVIMKPGVPIYVNGILDVGLSLYAGVQKSFLLRKLIGYGGVIARNSKIEKDDVVIIISDSGIEEVSIDLAINAQDFGARVIAILSKEMARSVNPDHPSGRRLDEIADIVIDNHIPYCGVVNDVLFVGNISSIVNLSILHGIFREAVKILKDKGKDVKIWRCHETIEDLSHNMELLDSSKDRLRSI